MSWKVVYTKQAQEDVKKLASSHLQSKAKTLIGILKDDPSANPPPFEKLAGDLSGAYSRRINIQHRLIYQLYEEEKIVKVIRMWTYYA